MKKNVDLVLWTEDCGLWIDDCGVRIWFLKLGIGECGLRIAGW